MNYYIFTGINITAKNRKIIDKYIAKSKRFRNRSQFFEDIAMEHIKKEDK